MFIYSRSASNKDITWLQTVCLKTCLSMKVKILSKKYFFEKNSTAIDYAEINDRSIILDLGYGAGLLLRTIRKINSEYECWGIDRPQCCDIKNSKLHI